MLGGKNTHWKLLLWHWNGHKLLRNRMLFVLKKHREDRSDRFLCRQRPDTSNVMKPKRRTFSVWYLQGLCKQNNWIGHPVGSIWKRLEWKKNTFLHMASTSTVLKVLTRTISNFFSCGGGRLCWVLGFVCDFFWFFGVSFVRFLVSVLWWIFCSAFFNPCRSVKVA